ncbi:MAG: SUMF1/EgtB/PvdO family nonheme iron enzyme [Bacteroidales bacterium]|nr:SUMF1/EgtB/PvdO family nonheme iron enzyme [Bacteroidales bacterium]
MKKIVTWALLLFAVVSCGGNGAVVSAPADLTPWQDADGLFAFTVNGETFRLSPIPAGTFAMGETLDQGHYRTPAVHQVILDGFAIGTAEVTQALWKAVMGSNPSPKDVPQAPVSGVSFDDAQKFLKKLSKATGVPFRLPTEAEWERAARLQEGMPGGVWEWCSDRWTDDLGIHLTVNPQGPEAGEDRALRGGSALEKNNKPITRKAMAPFTKAGDVGLRVAVSMDAPYPQDVYGVLVENQVDRARYKSTEVKPETLEVKGVRFDMVAVEGGTFTMGGTEQKGTVREDELPLHQVTLDPFKIGRLEVTEALWEAVMGSLPYGSQGPDYPVGNVSWYDVQAFIRELNALTGRKFRLPTEAEWEYAARGGQKSRGYAFAGSSFPQDVAQYGYDDMRTRKVALHRPNELGLYDMSGNAWEWVQDRPGPYDSTDQRDPQGPVTSALGDYRVMRGGSAATTWDKCRVSNRNEFHASLFRSTIGFRLAL